MNLMCQSKKWIILEDGPFRERKSLHSWDRLLGSFHEADANVVSTTILDLFATASVC